MWEEKQTMKIFRSLCTFENLPGIFQPVRNAGNQRDTDPSCTPCETIFYIDPQITQINADYRSIIIDELIIEIKAMGKLWGFEHERLVYCIYHKEKICGNLCNLWISKKLHLAQSAQRSQSSGLQPPAAKEN